MAPNVWPRNTIRDARRGSVHRRRRRDRTGPRVRHPAVRHRRGRLPLPLPRDRRGVRRRSECALRRKGLPVQRDCPLGRRRGAVARRVHRRRAGRRAARRISRRANRLARQQQIGRRADRRGQGRSRPRRGGLDDEIERLDAIAGEAGVVQDVWCASPSASRRTPTSSSPPRTRTRSSASRWPAARPWQAVRRVFATDHLRLVGLHSHIGSQIFDVGRLRTRRAPRHRPAARGRRRVRCRQDRADLDRRSRRRPGHFVPGRRRSAADSRIGEQAERHRRAASPRPWVCPCPRLVVEPGRAIAGPGTITLYEVGTVKDVDVERHGAPRATSASTAA